MRFPIQCKYTQHTVIFSLFFENTEKELGVLTWYTCGDFHISHLFRIWREYVRRRKDRKENMRFYVLLLSYFCTHISSQLFLRITGDGIVVRLQAHFQNPSEKKTEGNDSNKIFFLSCSPAIKVSFLRIDYEYDIIILLSSLPKGYRRENVSFCK